MVFSFAFKSLIFRYHFHHNGKVWPGYTWLLQTTPFIPVFYLSGQLELALHNYKKYFSTLVTNFWAPQSDFLTFFSYFPKQYMFHMLVVLQATNLSYTSFSSKKFEQCNIMTAKHVHSLCPPALKFLTYLHTFNQLLWVPKLFLSHEHYVTFRQTWRASTIKILFSIYIFVPKTQSRARPWAFPNDAPLIPCECVLKFTFTAEFNQVSTSFILSIVYMICCTICPLVPTKTGLFGIPAFWLRLFEWYTQKSFNYLENYKECRSFVSYFCRFDQKYVDILYIACFWHGAVMFHVYLVFWSSQLSFLLQPKSWSAIRTFVQHFFQSSLPLRWNVLKTWLVYWNCFWTFLVPYILYVSSPNNRFSISIWTMILFLVPSILWSPVDLQPSNFPKWEMSLRSFWKNATHVYQYLKFACLQNVTQLSKYMSFIILYNCSHSIFFSAQFSL